MVVDPDVLLNEIVALVNRPSIRFERFDKRPWRQVLSEDMRNDTFNIYRFVATKGSARVEFEFSPLSVWKRSNGVIRGIVENVIRELDKRSENHGSTNSTVN